MKLLVTTWRHWLPIKILWQGTEIGLTYKVGKQNYYVTKVGKLFAYCMKCEQFKNVILNGEYVDFTDELGNVVEPQLINDRTMVPMRKIFEVFGANVQWDGETETVTAVTEEKVLKLQINNPVAEVISGVSGETEKITQEIVDKAKDVEGVKIVTG